MNNTGIPDNYTKLCPSGSCSGSAYGQIPYPMGTPLGSTVLPLASSTGGAQMSMPQSGAQMSMPQSGAQMSMPQSGAQMSMPQSGTQMTMPQSSTQMNMTGQTQPLAMQYLSPQELLLRGIQNYQTQMPTQPKWSEIVPMMPSSTVPVTAESIQYLNGYLRTQIGRRITVEFLIGTNTLVDKTGLLLGVGINYIIINQTDTDDITICDFYNIKFITVYY